MNSISTNHLPEPDRGTPVGTRPSLRSRAFLWALLLGLLGDHLVRAPGRPGLGVGLWAIAGVAALVQLSRRRQPSISSETRWLVGGAVLAASLLMLGDAAALAAFDLLAGLVLLGFAAGRGALAWARSATVVDAAAGTVRVAALLAIGPLGWSFGVGGQPAARAAGTPSRTNHALLFARGLLMALPPLLLLAPLLASADPVFDTLLRRLVLDRLEPLLEHLFVAGVIAWFTSGYLRAFLVPAGPAIERVHLPRPALPPAEIAVALSLLNALFLGFLFVQVRYLFGGASLVEVTEGLTWASYARRGFFELVAAAALVVPVLLVAGWAAAEGAVRGRRALRAASILLVGLLVGVLASAAYRMRLYQESYGLTELRLYVSVFMVWLIGVLGWLAMVVLRRHRRGFTFATVVGGFACLIGLHAVDPHAMIARVNIDRAAAGAEVDGRYLRSLSADAVPTLVSRMPALPADERCRVETMLHERWSGERPGGWRSWNRSDSRARALVAELPAPAPCAEAARANEGRR